jgi:macrolide transport system ATP-binding/permease protein
MQDLRIALRQLVRNKGFSFTVILTLALSIGANTAIFSVVNALLLRPLAYPQPERLGTIYGRMTGTVDDDERSGVDGEKWELLRDNVPAVQAAVQSEIVAGINLQAGPAVQYVHAGRVSARYFDVLGTLPRLGRAFTEDEDRKGGPQAAILSDALWRTTFGANSRVLGTIVLLKGEPYTIVGVLPPHVTLPQNVDLYTPVRATREGEGMGANFDAIIRLRSGATWQQADAQINSAWAVRAERFAKANTGSPVSYYTVPLQEGQSSELRGPVIALMSAVGLILLIACANLAALTLVRISRRSPEFATRLALGASRWELLRQVWTEGMALAFLGGLAGIALAYGALRALNALIAPDMLPVSDISVDARVLAFTFAATIATSLLFGLLPALQTRRLDLRSGIAAGSSRSVSTSGHTRLRQVLIAGEIALTVVLLAGAGLLVRSLIYLETLPPGFDPNNVMTAKLSLDDARYHDPARFEQLVAKSLSAMRQIPGVQSSAMGLSLPYERGLNDGVKIADGKQAGQNVQSSVIYVSPAYFETLRIPVLGGRTFADTDSATSQPVAIVNAVFARRYLEQADAVGRQLGGKTSRVIVGVVADVAKTPGLNSRQPLDTEPTVYVPATQFSPEMLAIAHIWFQPSWIVRTSGPIEGLTQQMQSALASVDPSLPFSGFYRMSDLRDSAVSLQRIEVTLLTTLAGLALLLSTVGVFALVSNLVVQRTREIGIRIALGSTISQAMLEVGRSGIVSAGLGIGAGLVLSAFALRVAKSALFGVKVYDPATIAAVVMLLGAIALAASLGPTLRIARIHPAETLRSE